MYRDGLRKSAWQSEIEKFPQKVDLNRIFDVAIIGGGITGVSTALRLQKNGQQCILVEAANIGFGSTAGTTAHLNNFFDTPYAQVIKHFGLAQAQLLAKAATETMTVIQHYVMGYGIDCDYEKKTGYLFALDEKQEKALDDIMEGSEQVGHLMMEADTIPFPIAFKKAVSIPHQAQFHPIKYIKALCRAYIQIGGAVLEDCRCEQHEEEDDLFVLQTTKGAIRAKHIIYATHIPPGMNLLHLRNAPYRSYAMAFPIRNNTYTYKQALGYDLSDPYHYYRTHTIDGQTLLIAGGEDHKTGHEADTGVCFSNLEAHVRAHFEVDTPVYSWSSQYFEPADGLPYIGQMPNDKKGVFVATGYSGNGMIYGTLAARILSDLIIEGESKYAALFDPSRIKPVAGFVNFVKEGADVVVRFVKDKLFMERIQSLSEINPGEAKVVKFEGESYAIYKEADRGRLHVLKSTCPHAGCEVHWNSAEKTWDCPCHGSRFGVNGAVLSGPAVSDLPRVELEGS